MRTTIDERRVLRISEPSVDLTAAPCYPHRMFSPLVDLVFPPVCALCQRRLPVPHDPICQPCQRAMAWSLPPYCRRCGASLAGAHDADAECSGCALRPPAFERAVAPLQYRGLVRQAVHAFKYQHRRRIGAWLAARMAQTAQQTWDGEQIDAVVPVPMHWLKARARGDNPADSLARHVATLLQRPLTRGLLRRRRWTPSQTRLSPAARARNVAGAFGVARRAQPPTTLLLVDDVFTSGSTADACALALREAGASRVLVLSAARA